MYIASNIAGLVMGCLVVSALTTLAIDPGDLLGKPFTLTTAISLWPSNSVIQTQRRKFRIEPANIGNPIWTQEAYLVDRQGIDDNSIWYQEPVVEYDVSTNPSNKVGVLTGIRLYMNATNQEPVRAFLARYKIATPLLTNMCMRFPNQVWTGVDEVTFHEDRTLGTSNLPVRVFYRFEDGRLNRVTVALPLEESGLCRSVAVGAHISSDSVIDLPFLRRGGAVHVLGEHDMLLPDDKDKNIKLEKMRKLKEDDRAIAGEKIFEHLKGLGVFPVIYIRDACSRPPEDEGLYASHNMGIIVGTAASGLFSLEFDMIKYLFVNLKKVGDDVRIQIADGKFLPKTEEGCKSNMEITFESRRYDGAYKIWFCKDEIALLINKDGEVCMLGLSMHNATAMNERYVRRMNEYFMWRMIRCYEAKTTRDLESL